MTNHMTYKNGLFRVTALLLFTTLGWQPLAATNFDDHPNEIRDSAGRMRPGYSEIKETLNNLSPKKRRQFRVQSQDTFDGDNPLSPVPRILDPEEFEYLKNAIDQRARAMRAFLKDHYSGRKEYARANAIPKAVVDRAISRTGEAGFEGVVDPENINFFYGPDLVRARNGNRVSWYILEDNTGYVGGLGDLILAHEMMVDLHPALREKFDLNNPVNFYVELARELREQAAKKGGVAVAYRSDGPSEDKEGYRVLQIMNVFGVRAVSSKSGRKLRVENGRLYVLSPQDDSGRNYTKELVGSVFVEDELSWVDRTHPAMHDKHIMELSRMFISWKGAKKSDVNEMIKILGQVNPRTNSPSIAKLKRILTDSTFHGPERSAVPQLINTILAGRVHSTVHPGVDFMSDKEIYMYVEDMIRFYLKEEPLVKRPPTIAFIDAKTGQTREDLIEEVFSNIDDWVIKRFEGRGGKGVWVGNKITRSEAKELKEQVKIDPSGYLAQKKIFISRLDNDITDTRLLSLVTPNKVIMSPAPWGRGAPVKGDGKVNISSGGDEVAVIVGRKKAECEKLLKEEP